MALFLELCVLTAIFNQASGNPDAKRLYDDLLSGYNRLIRPVKNNSETVLVKLGLRLSQLIELNLKDQILTTNVWLEHEWIDSKFEWDPMEYGGMTEIYVPSEHIWLPDIVLYNNADGDYVITTMTKAVLHYSGKVFWTPPAIFKSSCTINVRYFPYDEQTCFMKFGSWSYGGSQIDLQHIHQKSANHTFVEMGMDLREYYPSVEWDILGVPAESHKEYYPCCPTEPYPDIFFNITLRRRTLFYTVNLIVPCVGISSLSILVFYLPADCGEKIMLGVTILLSQTMYFILIFEIMPSTSLALPLLGKYLLFTMALIGLCVIVTILILNIHYRKPSTHNLMGPWVRMLFIKIMPKVLLMRVPQQVLLDAAFKVQAVRSAGGTPDNNNGRKKVDAAGGAREKRPLQKYQRPHRGNCRKSTRDSFRFGRFSEINSSAIGERLSCLLGHMKPGSPLSEDEESTCCSGSEMSNRYPFKLEKTVHNVQFIQNRLQRLDEYNSEDLDWAFVAMVLDRFFLWIFTIATAIGTYMILCESPNFCATDITKSLIGNPTIPQIPDHNASTITVISTENS